MSYEICTRSPFNINHLQNGVMLR